jgi:hypothetical protein
MDFLREPVDIEDASVREGERVVADAAVSELARHNHPDVLRFLVELASRRMLPALAEAFGRYAVIEALPYLDRALEDDICRAAAEEALRNIGAPCREHLVLSATTPLPSEVTESASSLLRRRSAVAVLATIGIDPDRHWRTLQNLVGSGDPEIRVGACALGLDAGASMDISEAVDQLVAIAREVPWHLQDTVVRCLLAWFSIAEPRLLAEVERRSNAPDPVRAWDRALHLFCRVLNAAGRAMR